MMILHVDLDAFFASVEQRDNPGLRGKPIIVGGSSGRGVVSTASYEARRFGVHSAMPIFQAMKLCPQVILVPVDFAKYEKASRQFARLCSAFSPIIEQATLDELYIDLAGTEGLWESPRWVACQIRKKVKEGIGITCSVGISAQKTVAKIASGFKKPNGITEVLPGQEKSFLSPLPIRDLPGCGAKTQEFLEKFKVKTIGDLAKLDRSFVKTFFGKNGTALWEAANGQDRAKVTPLRDIKSISRSTTFPKDTNDKVFISGVLRDLTDRVALELREEKVEAASISVTIRTSDFKTTSKQKAASAPVATAYEIFNLAEDILGKLWDGRSLLRLVGVAVSKFVVPSRQSQLFGRTRASKWRDIEKAVDETRRKFGFGSIAPGSVFRLSGKTR